jgi:hypothetical protein
MLHHLGCGQLVLSTNKFNNKITMNKLEKQEGIYYTQNIENLPIEKRVFFREGKGVSATSEHYRVATLEEIAAWEEYKKQQGNTDIV